MRELSETAELSLDPAAIECLGKTRSGVLNVLVAVGMIVALSGFVLRGRATGAFPCRNRVNQGMFLGLGLIFVSARSCEGSWEQRPGSAIRSPGGRGSTGVTSCPPSSVQGPLSWGLPTAG